MRVLRFIFLTTLLFIASCNRAVNEQSRQLLSPTPQVAATPSKTESHPNQLAVTLAKVSSETARLNPRIAEAYSPAKAKLERTASAPGGFPGSEEPREELPPVGMRWVVVVLDHDAAQGEVSIPIKQIRVTDSSKRAYRLISFGGPESDTFDDLREYDKYKMVSPPKLIMQSPSAGKQSLLFAVASKSEGLSLEF